MRAYRLVKANHAQTPFDGEGAKRFGGRWNSEGTPMVYTSATIALATCEWRVHLHDWPPPPLLVIPVDFEEALVWIPHRLPEGWRSVPAPRVAAEFGDDWIKSRRSVVMRVPSAVVLREFNYLINPAHPDFKNLILGKASQYLPDARFAPLAQVLPKA